MAIGVTATVMIVSGLRRMCFIERPVNAVVCESALITPPPSFR